MTRSKSKRIDPWSQWADFAFAPWDFWFDAVVRPTRRPWESDPDDRAQIRADSELSDAGAAGLRHCAHKP